jgi:diguanylate cyclase (GGDEF)-like protein
LLPKRLDGFYFASNINKMNGAVNLSTDSPSSTNSSLSNPALQGAARFAVIGPAGLIAALALGAGATVMARDAAKTGLFVLAASILGALLCAFAATRLTNYPARRLTWLLSAGALILSGVGSFLSAKSPSLPAIALSAIAALLLCFAFLGLARVTGTPHAAQPGEEAENQAAPFDWALAPDALVIGGAVSAIVWWLFLEPAQIAARMKGVTTAAPPNGFHLVAFLFLTAAALLVAGRREMHPGVQSASGPVLIPGWTIAWLSAFSGVLFGAIAALAHLRPGGAPQLLETFLSVAAPFLIATLALWEGFNLQSQAPAHVEAPLDAKAARAFWLRNLAPLLCAGLAVIVAQIHFRGGAHHAKLGSWGELWWSALLILVALGRHAFDSLLNTRQTFEDYRSWNDLARGLQADVDARTRELSTLHEVAADLSNTLDSAKIISTALDRSINSLHADAGAVWLFKGEDEAETTLALTGTAGGDGFDSSAEARVERRKAQREGRSQETASARGSATALRKALVEAALGQALAEHRDDWMPKGGRWHLVRTTGNDSADRQGELQRNAIKSLHGGLEQGNIENALLACRSLSNSFQAAYIVPIQWKGEILGAFGILRSRGALSQAETALLQSLALEVGAALQNAYLYQEAVRLADRDSLSDLLNHRAVQQQLNVSLSRAARSRDQFVILMMDLNNFKFFNDTYGHQVGDEVIRRVAECLRQSCRISDVIGRYGGDEFIAILMDTDADGARIVVNRIEEKVAAQSLESDDGRRIPISLSFGGAIFPHDGEKGLELLGVADANVTEAKMAGGGFVMRSHAEESDELKALKDASVGGSFGVLDALVTAIDNKDNYTRRHSEDVARWGVMIGKQLGFTPEQQRSLRICGLLHDVGKIAVPDSVLRKPGRLNDDEFKVMQQHPVFGALIVKEVPDLDDVLGGIKHHHERFDGRGYPDRLPGLEIPLFGRILAVPDCFSAMTTNRPYRMGLSWDEAISEIVKGKGTQFDPDIADAFLRGIEELRKAESATEEAPAPAEEAEPEVPLTPEELEKFGEGGYFMNIKPRSVLDAELEKAEQK